MVLRSLIRFKSNRQSNGLTDFDSDLAKLDLVLIHEQVPRGGNLTSFILPRFTKNIIWINGERASFADVIAPYMLIQCKHTSNVGKKLVVNLHDELRKCGLLRKNPGADKSWISGQVALRAIWHMWSDEYVDSHNINLNYGGEKKEDFAVSDEMQQKSLAFPENALVNPNIGNKVESVTVSKDNGNWYIMNGSVSVEVPELSELVKPGEPRVSFVMSTNALRLVVKDKLGKTVCELCMDDIHENGSINLDLLAKRNEKDTWLKFKAKIVNGVDIKFLFT